jgi:ATP-binding protein involved in chromosome partitioning
MKDDFTLKGDVISALEGIEDPDKGENLLDAHMIEEVEVQGGVADLVLVVDSDRDRQARFDLEDAIYESVEALDGIREVKVKSMTPEALERERAEQTASPSDDQSDGAGQNASNAPQGQQGGGAPAGAGSPAAGGGQPPAGQMGGQQEPSVPQAEELEGVGQVLAVASGKGGVGKSTVAVNLALALKERGHRVGLLDVDIYGPSLPTLLGIDGRPSVSDRRIVPLKAHGLSVMSLGFLMDDDTPVIWRGPIVTGIIRQFLRDVDWSGHDYLVVDMPPGTGDAQLALAQTVPVDGAMVVTTPSELSLMDAARGFEMFNTLNVEVMGLISNMSRHVCPECGHESHIFGEKTVEKEVERLETRLLGDIPLDPDIRAGGDAGEPIVVGHPDSQTTGEFLNIADRVAEMKPPHAEDDADEATDADAGEGEEKGLFSFLKE